MLPLLWANRWVRPLSALCAGVGVGLFVDEVGKYISTANDYFFPLAAPIIYVVFLAVLGLARYMSRPRGRDARAQAYMALGDLTDVADGGLTEPNRDDLLLRLHTLVQADDRPDLAELAGAVLPFIARTIPAPPMQGHRHLQHALELALAAERRLLPRMLVRALLIVGALLIGLVSMIGLAVVVALGWGGDNVTIVIDDETVPPGSHPPALWAAAVGETVVGVTLLSAAVLLILGRYALGTRLLRAGLIFGLAAVNVVLGYVSAELVIVVTVVELAVLGLCLRYRRRFLPPVTAGGASLAIGGASPPAASRDAEAVMRTG